MKKLKYSAFKNWYCPLCAEFFDLNGERNKGKPLNEILVCSNCKSSSVQWIYKLIDAKMEGRNKNEIHQLYRDMHNYPDIIKRNYEYPVVPHDIVRLRKIIFKTENWFTEK